MHLDKETGLLHTDEGGSRGYIIQLCQWGQVYLIFAGAVSVGSRLYAVNILAIQIQWGEALVDSFCIKLSILAFGPLGRLWHPTEPEVYPCKQHRLTLDVPDSWLSPLPTFILQQNKGNTSFLMESDSELELTYGKRLLGMPARSRLVREDARLARRCQSTLSQGFYCCSKTP